MLQDFVIIAASFAYIGFLFAIAFYADKRADQGRSLIAKPYIYALSLGVYATAWTFYGSVGRAAIRSTPESDHEKSGENSTHVNLFDYASQRTERRDLIGIKEAIGFARGPPTIKLRDTDCVTLVAKHISANPENAITREPLGRST